MAYSSIASIPIAGLAGKVAGNMVRDALGGEHWLVRNVASGLVEAAASYVAGAATNLILADPVAPVTVTPAQALLQGTVRAVTGESAADLVHPRTFRELFETP